MKLDRCNNGLLVTQEASKVSSMPSARKDPAEQSHYNPECGVYILKQTHVHSCVPATICHRLDTRVVNSSVHYSPTVSHTGICMGTAQSSSMSDVTLVEPRHYLQMEEKSELVSNYLRPLTVAAPSLPHQSSRCQPRAPLCAAAQQLQNYTGGTLQQWEWHTGLASFGDDLSFPQVRAPHDLLRGTQSPARTNTAASDVSPLSTRADAERRDRITSSVMGEHSRQTALWLADGVSNPAQHPLPTDFCMDSTRNPVILGDIWQTPFPLASQEKCCLHLNTYDTTKLAPRVDCEKHGEAAEGPSQHVRSSNPCLPIPITYSTTNADVQDKHSLHERQTLVVEKSSADETVTRLKVFPPASPLPPHGCSMQSDTRDEAEDIGVLGLYRSDIQNETEAGKSVVRAQQSAGKNEQQGTTAGERQKVEDAVSALAQQRRFGGHSCITGEYGSLGGPCDESWAVSRTEQHLSKSERLSEFISALHKFLASGELFDKVDKQLTVETASQELSPQHHCKEEHRKLVVAKPGVGEPEVIAVATSRDAPTSCITQCTDEKTESLTHSVKTKDAALVASGNICDPLGRPFYTSSACSERTSCCSGITALGSEMSSYAGTNFDRSASYTSCSSRGGGGYSTLGTLMSGTFEHTETEKVGTGVCSSLGGSSCTSSSNSSEEGAPAMAPHHNYNAGAAPTAETSTTGTPKDEYVKRSPEAFKFQKLVRAFYADNSRHSVLWNGCQRDDPSYSPSAQDHLTVQLESWTAAAGIAEVTQQVQVLVKRLRGLQLVTRELAAIPDASGALCCCLSGDLTAYATSAESTAAASSTKWKFEQLLVLSVQDHSLPEGMQRKHGDLSAVTMEEVPNESLTGLYGFQIQEEVFVVSPVDGAQARNTTAVTVVSHAESEGQLWSSDLSEKNSKGDNAALVRAHSTSGGGSYRCPLGRGWTAFLQWKGQRGVREWANVFSSSRNLRTPQRSNCREVRAWTSQQLLRSTCAGVDVTPAGGEWSVPSSAATRKSGDQTLEGENESYTANTTFGQQPGPQTAAAKTGGFPSEPQHHRIGRLHTNNSALELWSPARGGELDRKSGRTILEALASHEGGTPTTGETCQVVASTQLARLPIITDGGWLTGPYCHDELQLRSGQKIHEFDHSCLSSGGVHYDHSSAHRAPKNRSQSGIHRSPLPVLASLPEAARVSPKELMNALLHCLQNFDVKGDTSSSFTIDSCSLATANACAESAAPDGSSKAHPSFRTHKDGCELRPTGLSSKLEASAAAGIRDNAEAPVETNCEQLVPTEWGRADSSREGPYGTLDAARTTQKGSISGKHGGRRGNWGGEGLEAGPSRERPPRRRSPRADSRGRIERQEWMPDIEEHLHSLGFFREHCTVFVSWVPRAARADDLKQKTSMEMRVSKQGPASKYVRLWTPHMSRSAEPGEAAPLKVLLQMAMGVRGIVRVALFPPRGSHCCVLFESPAAASAFIEEYGGPTFTSSTEQFKADICAAYAVALDRGIERVFIRIEEFKPHVLQHHVLQHTRDRSPPAAREWHERRRDCAAASNQPPAGRRRQHQVAALRERGRKSVNYPSPVNSIPPFRNTISHSVYTRDAANGQSSASPRGWQMHDRTSETCSLHRPLYRKHVTQQMAEKLSHPGHRSQHRNR